MLVLLAAALVCVPAHADDGDRRRLDVAVPGVSRGPVKRLGCPGHGVALTPDETEVGVADACNQKLHIFDATYCPRTTK